VAAVETVLEELDADPERVKRLTGWHWIMDTFHHLPQNHAAYSIRIGIRCRAIYAKLY
jgi:hypothetical protein